MILISAISISLILVVFFLDQSGCQFPYLDFLRSSYTPDFLPTEKSIKGLAPIAELMLMSIVLTFLKAATSTFYKNNENNPFRKFK